MVLKDKLVMKKVCMLLLLLFICNIGLVLAQGRRFGFELGANYPIGLQKNGYKENHVGFYLNGIYRFPTNPLSVNLKFMKVTQLCLIILLILFLMDDLYLLCRQLIIISYGMNLLIPMLVWELVFN